MSDSPSNSPSSPPRGQKRKNPDQDTQPIEIDVNAPEPSSKKDLRKAKKAKISKPAKPASNHPPTNISSPPTSDDADSNPDSLSAQPRAAHQNPNPNPNRSLHGIWIGNLAFFTTKPNLQTFLLTHPSITASQITRIHLPLDHPGPGHRSQRNKGFAHIDFDTAASATHALELSEKLLGGRRVLIKPADNFAGRPDPKLRVLGPEASWSRRIFVGNLDFDVTREALEAHFGVCGPLRDVHVATFEDSGKCKGYAWVEFEDLEGAKKAMIGKVDVEVKAEGETEVDAEAKTQDENQGDETSSDEAGDVKKPEPKSQNGTEGTKKKTKIFIKTMGGRKLRMEFAEDKATRYQKRFGKGSTGKVDTKDQTQSVNQSKTAETNPDPQASTVKITRPALPPNSEPTTSQTDPTNATKDRERPRKSHRPPIARPGYTSSSIQKLTGAIPEVQSKKITFS